MMFNLLFTSILLSTTLLSTRIAAVDALPLPYPSTSTDLRYPARVRRDVYNPAITYPTQGEVWTPGSQVTVTWDVSSIPAGRRNTKSMVVLGWMDSGDTNEHLDLNHPLAHDFPIGQACVTFVVPNVPPRDNYIVVVFGDSGNHSPAFTIKSISPPS
ncbi:hypothetical protein FPV67DRAFT_744617 [Lyophyllum atratum]|nr:hypothetical protein FPV67DRAFT_744617 [Lyophyllum atratum]